MEKRQENKMGVMPVKRLLITMSLPLMISMLVQALYNVVDSIFISRVSEKAFAALSFVFPVQIFMIAVAVGTGVGINALLSRRLGECRYEEANLTAMNGIFIYVLSWLVFAVLGLFFSRSFFEIFTQDAEIVEAGTRYMSICTVFSLGMYLQFAAERLMQSTGNTVYQMLVQGLGALINIALDPIFIFGLLGMPKMGVAGAAIATVIGQTIAMVVGMILNVKKNHDIKLSLRGFRPDKRIILDIYRVGLPAIVMQSLVGIMTMGLNRILVTYSYTLVLVLGTYFKAQSFVFMPIFGITGSMIPIVGYNYGARKRKRIVDTIKQGLIMSISIMGLGTLLFQILPAPLLLLFNASPTTLAAGIPALRIISSSFVISGVFFVFVSVFQALGKGVLSMILSIARQLVVILPAAYLICRFLSPDLVWLVFPLAEILTTTLCMFMYRNVYRNQIAPLDAPVFTQE